MAYFVWLILLIITISGCMTSSTRTSSTIIEHGKNVSIALAYENAEFFKVSPQVLYMHLLDRLYKRGAQLFVSDYNSGIISWYDSGMSFVAMPGYVDKIAFTYGSKIKVLMAVWHGIVHGTARIRSSKEGVWLYLHLVGREIGSEKERLSDGSCERNLFKEIADSLKRKTLTIPLAGFRADNRLPAADLQEEQTYAKAFASHFRVLPEFSPNNIRENGLSKIYPVPFDDLWAACLDVICQYTSIVDVSVSEGLIVFSHQIALPEKMNGKTIKPVDVLMAIYVDSRGERGSSVHAVMLSDPGLAVRPIIGLRQEHPDDVLARLKNSPTDLAAALIADGLFGQLATQLFHEERWMGKLTRRLTAKTTQKYPAK